MAASSALDLQALDENLWTRSIVLMLGNLSKPSGSSKLDIVEVDGKGPTEITKNRSKCSAAYKHTFLAWDQQYTHE